MAASLKYDYSDVYMNIEKFDPQKYLKEFYSTLSGSTDEGDFLNFFYNTCTEFAKILPNKLGRALDFGCGPTIHGLLPVANKIDSAIYADYVPANLKEIEKWVSNKEDCFSYRHFSEVYEKALGIPAVELENDLRSKIKGTMECDVFQDDMLPLNNGEAFDFIYTSLCIEGASTNIEDYNAGVSKLVKMLTPGGYAMQFCVLNQHKYQCNGVTIPSLYVTYEQAKNAWLNSGCTIIKSKQLSSIEEGNEIGLCLILSQK